MSRVLSHRPIGYRGAVCARRLTLLYSLAEPCGESLLLVAVPVARLYGSRYSFPVDSMRLPPRYRMSVLPRPAVNPVFNCHATSLIIGSPERERKKNPGNFSGYGLIGIVPNYRNAPVLGRMIVIAGRGCNILGEW